MKPRTRELEAQEDLFRARLEQIINMDHALVRLAKRMDWAFFDETFGALYSDKGRPGVPTRLMAGLH